MQSLEDSNLSILNDVSSIVNNEKLSDRDKIIALRALVETKTQNLKTLLVEKSLIETSNLDRFDFLEKGLHSNNLDYQFRLNSELPLTVCKY